MDKNHKRRIQAASLVFAVLLCQDGVADITEPENVWKETGLDFAFIERRVSTASCHRTEANFAACAKAIQALLDLHRRKLRLVVTEDIARISNRVMVGQFGVLAVVEQKGQLDGQSRPVFEEIRARHEQEQAWRAAFADKDAYVEFARLREWAMSEIVEPGKREAYAAAAINGYISVSDVHARIFPAAGGPNSLASGSRSRSMGPSGMRYSGVGVAIEHTADAILITNVVKESPAAAMGLRPSDVILAIEGEPVGGKSVPEVVDQLRGPPSTEVALTIRSKEKTRSLKVQRANVEVKNVVASVIEDRGKRWGHLHIRGFVMPNTCAAAEGELRKLKRQAVDGIVLDLRDNIGGRIDLAVCVADHFLPAGLKVVEMRSLKDQQRRQQFYTRFAATSSLPLVSLVNAGTGSASEVLVSALQDHGRGSVVGQRTFGKATMQTIRPWNGSKSILQYRTVARMYAPSGHSAQMVGITPDIVVRSDPTNKAIARQALRLEDLFPSALPAEDVTAKIKADADIDGLRVCVADKGVAEQRWQAAKSEGGDTYDYPLHVAQDALNCLATESREAENAHISDDPLYALQRNEESNFSTSAVVD
jgi:C-terminal peptidase prc